MGGAPTNPTRDPGDTRHLTIGSRLEELEKVYALIEEVAREHGLDEDFANALMIAVIEAGTNAIQHGNVFADHKSVTFSVTVTHSDIVVRVDDFGNGFDPMKVLNPTEDAQLMKTHGRGLYLMRSLMDEVTFSTRPDHGTTVLLRKTRLARSR